MKYGTKKKKTKEQKILAEKRRQIQSLAEEKYSYAIETPSPASPIIETLPPTMKDHKTVVLKTNPSLYFLHDLKKTIVVTAIIIVIQILLHNFIK